MVDSYGLRSEDIELELLEKERNNRSTVKHVMLLFFYYVFNFYV